MINTSLLPNDPTLVSRVLNNARRNRILNYLDKAGFATNGVIARVLDIRASQVSKDLKIMLDAGFLEKDKYGKRIVFMTTNKWKSVKVALSL